MEEHIFTGYCRCIDQSRMVEAETESGKVFADCAWPDCPHCGACLIAKELQQLVEKEQ